MAVAICCSLTVHWHTRAYGTLKFTNIFFLAFASSCIQITSEPSKRRTHVTIRAYYLQFSHFHCAFWSWRIWHWHTRPASTSHTKLIINKNNASAVRRMHSPYNWCESTFYFIAFSVRPLADRMHSHINRWLYGCTRPADTFMRFFVVLLSHSRFGTFRTSHQMSMQRICGRELFVTSGCAPMPRGHRTTDAHLFNLVNIVN